jgi:hypothetical protein
LLGWFVAETQRVLKRWQMKIENVEVYGFCTALRCVHHCMHHRIGSWAESDNTDHSAKQWDPRVKCAEWLLLNPRDIERALALLRKDEANRTFLRMIAVWWDITVPCAIWQQLDAYSVSSVGDSCSTMNELGLRDLEQSDFQGGNIDPSWLSMLNRIGAAYRIYRAPQYWHELRMNLPGSFLQKATYRFDYEVAMKMYFDHRDDTMQEWSGPEGICHWILLLPYMGRFVDATKSPGSTTRKDVFGP